MSSAKVSMQEQVNQNFNESNAFHRIVKEYGEDVYVRVLTMATEEQQEALERADPIADIVQDIRSRALEIFKDRNFLNGLKLEDELGL